MKLTQDQVDEIAKAVAEAYKPDFEKSQDRNSQLDLLGGLVTLEALTRQELQPILKMSDLSVRPGDSEARMGYFPAMMYRANGTDELSWEEIGEIQEKLNPAIVNKIKPFLSQDSLERAISAFPEYAGILKGV